MHSVGLTTRDQFVLNPGAGARMNSNGSFGHWLAQRRKALDLTQAELADQVGCAVITIRKIEQDVRRPSKQIAESLADVLAISSDDRSAFLAFARRPTVSAPIPR